MTNESIVEFRSVSKIFGGTKDVAAVRDVSFVIEADETIAIMGPSGSGKSTILNLAAGIDSPTSGEILIAGENLAGLSDDELTRLRRENIGLIFQSFNLLNTLTALENVSLPSRLRGSGRKEAEIKARELLELVDLVDRADHLPDEMSGGERQRVAIARAMVSDPILLLADEPTGNLDSAAGAKILEVLISLNKEFGTTIVLVTHDEAAARFCDRLIGITDGVIREDSYDRRTGAGLAQAVEAE